MVSNSILENTRMRKRSTRDAGKANILGPVSGTSTHGAVTMLHEI